MIRAIVLLLTVVLFGCATPLRGPLLFPQQNDCLPQAIAMAEGLRKYGIPARVLGMRPERGMGHAVTVYDYKGKLWVWDRYWGSVESGTGQSWEPLEIASVWWLRWGRRSGIAAPISARYHE